MAYGTGTYRGFLVVGGFDHIKMIEGHSIWNTLQETKHSSLLPEIPRSTAVYLLKGAQE